MRGKGRVTEESKPTTQASPLLFDLTSLQREGQRKIRLLAKTTLALAQSLYERHKALTYHEPTRAARGLPARGQTRPSACWPAAAKSTWRRSPDRHSTGYVKNPPNASSTTARW